MSARDEHPWTHKLHDNDGTLLEVSVSAADYEAMCDRIDTLTAERVELRSDLSDLNDEICECKMLEVTAELRSLRAAVATMKIAVDDCNDVDWRTVESHDYAEARDEAIDAVCALVPLDGSWETGQDVPCSACVAQGFDPEEANPTQAGIEYLTCPHCKGSGIEPSREEGNQ